MATGYNKGALRLLGLPVDTAANVLDLAKAAVGTPWLLAGKVPPEILQPMDRKNVFLSGDYMIDRLNQTQVGNALLTPRNPEYRGGYLEMSGAGLSGVMAPGSLPQFGSQAAGNVTSAVLSKAAADATGDPAWAITAAMTPSALRSVAGDATKFALRGGEEGRRNMAQRVQDMRNAGVSQPTVGVTSDRSTVRGLENFMTNTPGAATQTRRARERTLAELQATTRRAADLAGAERGAEVAGTNIQRDIRGPFRERVGDNYTRYMDRVEASVGPNGPAPTNNAVTTAARLTRVDPNAPETTALLAQPRISGIGNALARDSGGSPQTVVNSRLLDERGFPFQTVVPAMPAAGIPFNVLRRVRTSIGDEAASNAIIGTPEQAQWKQLYGAMSRDLRDAARTADLRVGPQPNNMGPAERNTVRANAAYTAGRNRLERIEPFAQKAAPEDAFKSLMQTTKENTSTLRAVKKSVTPETRASIAATVIERLGRARPGSQNDVSDVWSHETFLTNWNNMNPQARRELFSGFRNADDVRAEVEQVARAASILRDASKAYANPSGTGANIMGRATVGAVGLGGVGALTGLVDPTAVSLGLTALGGANAMARANANPKVVNWLTAPRSVDTGAMTREFNALVGMGLLAPN